MPQSCWRWLLDGLPRPSDTEMDVRIKRAFIPLNLFFTIYAGFVALMSYRDSILMRALACAVCCVAALTFEVGVLLNITSGRNLIDCFLYMVTVGLFLLEIANVALSSSFRPWTFLMLVLDTSLVYYRDHVPGIVVPVTIIIITTEEVERMVGFGLYDAGYWGTDVESNQCNCASPPCAVPTVHAVSGWVAVCTVFLVDFWLTRGFSSGMRMQLRNIESSIAVAEEVAEALGRYDVDEAEQAIAAGEDLPPRLRESFLVLVANLRSYRDFIPDALLENYDNETCHTPTVGPPVRGEGPANVGMVFTDIQSSTSLWEGYPSEMYDALRTHNTTLREVAKEHSGYEVK
eukprot:Hpha_TRINITY_DN16693_c0_g1::TRINITY_DN16693_c0_g1_i1::g.180561::m.180561